MYLRLNQNNLHTIKNADFARYAQQYQDIYDGFVQQVETFGLKFAEDQEQQSEELRSCLTAENEENDENQTHTVCVRNNGASLVWGDVSTACAACRMGIGSHTGFISLMCHRDCFYCFNPNQENFETFACQKQNWKTELEQMYRQGIKLTHIALTGGEPLLHKKDMILYFQMARKLWPGIHMRLYTSGDLLNQEILEELKSVGLNEIRFSLKLEDTDEGREKVFENMELSKEYIADVMVEMPVLPDTQIQMRQILDRLEKIGISGINLLEFCFPFNNAEEFAKRGYKLRYPPYKTLYNFWYAGGLPVAGSEVLALQLLQYVREKQYKLNVHYCSLENKHFGQIYMQNSVMLQKNDTYLFSERDFYLKTIKIFGRDAEKAEQILKKSGCKNYLRNREWKFIQMHPECAKLLKHLKIELGISYNVQEMRDGEVYIRELRLDYSRADQYSAEDL